MRQVVSHFSTNQQCRLFVVSDKFSICQGHAVERSNKWLNHFSDELFYLVKAYQYMHPVLLHKSEHVSHSGFGHNAAIASIEYLLYNDSIDKTCAYELRPWTQTSDHLRSLSRNCPAPWLLNQLLNPSCLNTSIGSFSHYFTRKMRQLYLATCSLICWCRSHYECLPGGNVY